MANEQIEKVQMTLKAVPVATRALMSAAAARAGLPLGMWLVKAVEDRAKLEANNGVMPEEPPAPPVDLVQLRDTMQTAVLVAQASGLPVPKGTARHCYALLTQRLRVDRGMPARVRRRPVFRRIGQTAKTIEAAE